MFSRLAHATIIEHLQWSPAVGILGPRQVGKTTLAKTLATDPEKSIYLDLDTSQAMARLANPTAFFAANRQRLVVLDEIQNQPQLLSIPTPRAGQAFLKKQGHRPLRCANLH